MPELTDSEDESETVVLENGEGEEDPDSSDEEFVEELVAWTDGLRKTKEQRIAVWPGQPGDNIYCADSFPKSIPEDNDWTEVPNRKQRKMKPMLKAR